MLIWFDGPAESCLGSGDLSGPYPNEEFEIQISTVILNLDDKMVLQSSINTRTIDHIVYLTPPGSLEETSQQFRELGFK